MGKTFELFMYIIICYVICTFILFGCDLFMFLIEDFRIVIITILVTVNLYDV